MENKVPYDIVIARQKDTAQCQMIYERQIKRL